MKDFQAVRQDPVLFVRPTSSLHYDSFHWLAQERKNKLQLRLVIEEVCEDGESSLRGIITNHGKPISRIVTGTDEDMVSNKVARRFIIQPEYEKYTTEKLTNTTLLSRGKRETKSEQNRTFKYIWRGKFPARDATLRLREWLKPPPTISLCF